MQIRWLLAALLLSALLSALNWYALEHFWYWTYRWFDTPMHALGGAVTGVLVVAFSRKFRPLLYMLVVAAVAIGWEVFEWHFGLSRNQPNYFLDTMHDLLNDTLGAVLVYVVARITVWRSV